MHPGSKRLSKKKKIEKQDNDNSLLSEESESEFDSDDFFSDLLTDDSKGIEAIDKEDNPDFNLKDPFLKQSVEMKKREYEIERFGYELRRKLREKNALKIVTLVYHDPGVNACMNYRFLVDDIHKRAVLILFQDYDLTPPITETSAHGAGNNSGYWFQVSEAIAGVRIVGLQCAQLSNQYPAFYIGHSVNKDQDFRTWLQDSDYTDYWWSWETPGGLCWWIDSKLPFYYYNTASQPTKYYIDELIKEYVENFNYQPTLDLKISEMLIANTEKKIKELTDYENNIRNEVDRRIFHLEKLIKEYDGTYSVETIQEYKKEIEDLKNNKITRSEQMWPFDPSLSTTYFGNVGWFTPATFQFWGLSIPLFQRFGCLVGSVSDTLIQNGMIRSLQTIERTPIVLIAPKMAFGRDDMKFYESFALTDRDQLYNNIKNDIYIYVDQFLSQNVRKIGFFDGITLVVYEEVLHSSKRTKNWIELRRRIYTSIISFANDKQNQVLQAWITRAVAVMLFNVVRTETMRYLTTSQQSIDFNEVNRRIRNYTSMSGGEGG